MKIGDVKIGDVTISEREMNNPVFQSLVKHRCTLWTIELRRLFREKPEADTEKAVDASTPPRDD